MLGTLEFVKVCLFFVYNFAFPQMNRLRCIWQQIVLKILCHAVSTISTCSANHIRETFARNSAALTCSRCTRKQKQVNADGCLTSLLKSHDCLKVPPFLVQDPQACVKQVSHHGCEASDVMCLYFGLKFCHTFFFAGVSTYEILQTGNRFCLFREHFLYEF